MISKCLIYMLYIYAAPVYMYAQSYVKPIELEMVFE